MYKRLKVKLYPTKNQIEMLENHFDGYRFAYNLSLEYKQKKELIAKKQEEIKILISGGTGFLGGYTAKFLKSKGYEIGVLGRNLEKAKNLQNEGIKFYEIDFSMEEQIEELINIMNDYDYVVHSGAMSSICGSYKDFYNANVLGSKNMVEASIKANIKKFIHISSPSIYYDYKDRLNVEETFLPQKFANHYAKTKYEAEQLLKLYKEKIEIIILRPRAIIGPGDTSIFPKLIALNNRRGIPLFNKGKSIIDVTYVKNVSHAIELSILNNKELSGEAYNITNGEPGNIKELLDYFFNLINQKVRYISVPIVIMNGIGRIFEVVSKITNKDVILTRYSIGVLINSFTLNIEKAKKDLNYEPIISLKDGLEEYSKLIEK